MKEVKCVLVMFGDYVSFGEVGIRVDWLYGDYAYEKDSIVLDEMSELYYTNEIIEYKDLLSNSKEELDKLVKEYISNTHFEGYDMISDTVFEDKEGNKYLKL